MKVEFKQAEDCVSEFTEVHYDPIGWLIHNLDARTIVPTFQQVFETDFSLHCDEEGKEYSRSYRSIRDFLSHADLEGKHIIKISCVIPIHGENYDVIIDFKMNTLYVFYDKHVDGVKLSLFDTAIQKVSHSLSQKKPDGSYLFQKQVKNWKYDHHTPSSVKYIFHPACREKHDMIVLKAFDQRYHLSTISTMVWDQERHFWRTFEGFKQYRKEAPDDAFYKYLDKLSFVVCIDEVRYRVSVHLGDRLSLSRIEIEFDTDHPYDFTPIMEELERQITQQE